MKTAYFYGGSDIRVEDAPVPEPGRGEVQLRVHAAGVCGSDLHNYRGRRPPALAVPWQQGHELAGEVTALGEGVTGLAVGQRVAVEAEHLLGCGKCRWCAERQNQLCPERGFLHGARHSSHGFSQYDVCVATNVHPFPDSISYEQAALLDCYACGVHALNRTPVQHRDTAVIIGAGAIAFTLGQVLKANGAGRVIMTGTRAEPLALALEARAADSVICVREEDPVAAVLEATNGEGAASTFETVGGVEQLIAQATQMTRRGGAISILGLFTTPQTLDPSLAMQRELTIRWSNSFSTWRGESEYKTALSLMSSGKLTPDPIITHRFGIERIGEAFAAADDKRSSRAIRVMVNP
jgi:threonine dehydrogenase-like Zn-dependent dehydrogenase